MKWLTQILSTIRQRREDKLMPERKFVVEFDDRVVSLSHPERKKEVVPWVDIDEVAIATTDNGPWACDWFWVLRAGSGGLVVPQGATGESKLLERLQQLPGFDNGAILAVGPRTDKSQVTCWKRAS
jgi:hypothetical protein